MSVTPTWYAVISSPKFLYDGTNLLQDVLQNQLLTGHGMYYNLQANKMYYKNILSMKKLVSLRIDEKF